MVGGITNNIPNPALSRTTPNQVNQESAPETGDIEITKDQKGVSVNLDVSELLKSLISGGSLDPFNGKPDPASGSSSKSFEEKLLSIDEGPDAAKTFQKAFSKLPQAKKQSFLSRLLSFNENEAMFTPLSEIFSEIKNSGSLEDQLLSMNANLNNDSSTRNKEEVAKNLFSILTEIMESENPEQLELAVKVINQLKKNGNFDVKDVRVHSDKINDFMAAIEGNVLMESPMTQISAFSEIINQVVSNRTLDSGEELHFKDQIDIDMASSPKDILQLEKDLSEKYEGNIPKNIQEQLNIKAKKLYEGAFLRKLRFTQGVDRNPHVANAEYQNLKNLEMLLVDTGLSQSEFDSFSTDIQSKYEGFSDDKILATSINNDAEVAELKIKAQLTTAKGSAREALMKALRTIRSSRMELKDLLEISTHSDDQKKQMVSIASRIQSNLEAATQIYKNSKSKLTEEDIDSFKKETVATRPILQDAAIRVGGPEGAKILDRQLSLESQYLELGIISAEDFQKFSKQIDSLQQQIDAAQVGDRHNSSSSSLANELFEKVTAASDRFNDDTNALLKSILVEMYTEGEDRAEAIMRKRFENENLLISGQDIKDVVSLLFTD
jgi:hypothetical protein